MGYLQALKLMVRAYKAAKGVMPKGLDLLKLKMRARQKAIDSQKVIEFPKDRITNPFKPRPEGIEKLIKKGDVKIGKAPKTTKVKEPVDPKLILQESEKQTLARMRKENKEAIKRFKEKMDKPRDGKATGGLANLSAVYDNNPTLQAQYPNKKDYLDLFSRTGTITPLTKTYAQMTQQSPAAGIPAIKPIILPGDGDGDDSGGNRVMGRTYRNQPNYMGGKEPGIFSAIQRGVSEIRDTPLIKYNPMNPMFLYNVGKKGLEKAREFARKIEEQKQQERIAEARAKAQARAAIAAADSGYDYDPGGGNYGMGFGPGRTDPTDKS